MKRTQRGAVSVEVALGALFILALLGFILDYGLLLHRRALLFDVTLKTVQEVSRDPHAARSFDQLVERSRELFGDHAERLAGNRASELTVSRVGYDCDFGSISVAAEWATGCVFCVLDRFTKVLHAESNAMIESPGQQLPAQGASDPCTLEAVAPWS